MTGQPSELPPSGGLLLVDKPSECTSHDVVSRVRRILSTRRVGHAGTLDPMATGLLVVAIERSTKLLTHLVLTGKSYDATIRLGQATSTDDADGEIIGQAGAVGVDDAQIAAGITALTGELSQVPSAVSAIKVAGRRAYELARRGETVVLPARRVTVSSFEISAPPRRHGGLVDVDVQVQCSSGTYVRALARDLGGSLGTGGHLIRLRRTRVGPFGVAASTNVYAADVTAEAVAAQMMSPSQVARAAWPVRVVSAAERTELGFGRPIARAGIAGTYAALDEVGELIALLTDFEDVARTVLVWRPAN